MRRLLLLVAVGCCTLGSENAFGQDPEFSQFYSNPLYLNPAFAGSHQCPRVALNYRNQWPALSGTFVTQSVSYDQGVDALYGGLGLMVVSDQAGRGILKTNRVSGQYAYQGNITNGFSIRVGVEATYFQRTLDWSKLTFGDMIDDRRGFIYQTSDIPRGGSVSGIDISAGILGFSENFFIGVAGHHLTEPDESLIGSQDGSPIPMKLTGHAGAVIELGGGGPYSGGATLSPNIMYRQQAGFRQLNMGLYITQGVLTGGVWYRNKDAFIVSLGIKTGMFQFGYTYDVTVSKLANASAGSHEIGMMFNFDCQPKKRKFRVIRCPSF